MKFFLTLWYNFLLRAMKIEFSESSKAIYLQRLKLLEKSQIQEHLKFYTDSRNKFFVASENSPNITQIFQKTLM